MKKSLSKIALVFMMVAMLFCLSTPLQANTTDGPGSQGMTSSTIPLPPTAPAPQFDLDIRALLLFLMFFF